MYIFIEANIELADNRKKVLYVMQLFFACRETRMWCSVM